MSSKERNRKLQKLLVIISRVMATLVILSVLFLLLPLSIPRILGCQTYNVVSGSMEPEIPVGSLLMVKPIEGKELKEGDIIAFYSNGTVVAHRVVSNNTFEGRITTKGDANAQEDISDVSYQELIGIVEKHIPYMGAVGAYISSVSGKLLLSELIVVSLLLYIVSARIRL
jgi:signal peptidase I